MKKLLIAALLIAGALGYVQRSFTVFGVRETVQELLDKKIEANALKVGYVDVPTLARIPMIGQSTWNSYFVVTDKKGDRIDLEKCPGSGTTDYEVRFSDSELLVSVHLNDLRKCSDAINASKS